jgi:hypothetical protein
MVPFGVLEGYTDELRSGISIVKQWLLGIAIIAAFAVVLSASISNKAAEIPIIMLNRLIAGRTKIFVSGVLTVIFATLVAISQIVFKNRPMNIDAIVQLFQAKSFARGYLFAPPPPFPEFFITLNNLFEPTGWYSQYPPGHIAILALGVLCGAPWLIMVACSTLTALFLFLFVREIYDERTAKLSLLLLVLTPFFLFMGASQMNHVTTALFVSMALYYYALWENTQRNYLLGFCGACLGVAFLSRPLCAITAGAVLGFFFLSELRSRPDKKSALQGGIVGVVGFLPFALLILLYNKLTTGDPFLPGYLKLWGNGHGLGFHETPFGKIHSVPRGLQNELFDIALLSEYLFEWPIPALTPVAIALAFGLYNQRWDKRLLLLFFAYPSIYFFYWHRDTFLGPRFLYLSILSAVPLTVRALQCLSARYRDSTVKIFPSQPALSLRRMVVISVTICFFYSALIGLPLRFKIYNNGLNSLKGDLIGEAREQGIKSGLIFVPVSWGSRIISKLRALGVPAHTVEKTYRSSDHCELDRIANEYWGKGAAIAEIEAAVSSLRGEKVQKYKLNGDPTLRLSPTRRPSAECWEEINYDANGYHLFMPYLADNNPDLTGPFVIATDLRKLNNRLIARYRELPAYIYRKGRFSPLVVSPDS